MAKTSPTEFVQQVRQEVARVTWPTRKETIVTSAMVFAMVFVAAAFFLDTPPGSLSAAFDIGGRPISPDEQAFCDFMPLDA